MKIALAYAEADNEIVKKIETELIGIPHEFEHYVFNRTNPEYKLSEVLDDFKLPILLFISDKFLRSTSSMDGILHFFQKKEAQILPIILSSVHEGEVITPDVSKVGGIIQYINYWQEHYLDMRRQKRELKLATEDSFQRHLNIIRDISTEIGEFLRQLRSTDFYTTAELQDNAYATLFEFLDDETAWEKYKISTISATTETEKEISTPPTKSIITTDTDNTTSLDENEVDLEQKLSSIPGISLLQEKENAIEEDEVKIEIKTEVETSIVVETDENTAAEIIKEDTTEEISTATESDKTPSADTQTTLDALKKNIDKLTTLLKNRDQTAKDKLINRDGTGKTVLITGATSGIGKATALIFAKNGFNLILTGRRIERLQDFSSTLENTHQIKTKILCFDVRSRTAAQEAIEGLEKEWKTIDILINNAGKAKGFSPIHEGSFEHWEEMVDTNIKGVLYLTRLVAPLMVSQQSGHIINIGSIAGKEAYPNGNVYCATKFAIDGLTKAMRIDLHTHNIRVSQIAPAHVEETEFAFVRFDGDEEKAKIYEDFTPLNARDIAESIYFIATRPAHVNILDVVIQGTQQPSASILDRSGRK